jgi:hypothetical protein
LFNKWEASILSNPYGQVAVGVGTTATFVNSYNNYVVVSRQDRSRRVPYSELIAPVIINPFFKGILMGALWPLTFFGYITAENCRNCFLVSRHQEGLEVQRKLIREGKLVGSSIKDVSFRDLKEC